MKSAPDPLTDGLRQRFQLITSRITIGGREWELFHPRSADELIDEEAFNRDERLPYWADIWPGARELAERIAAESGSGRQLLELGCGVGLPSLVAAQAGFEVTATDYYAEALEVTRLNFRHNGLQECATRSVDWRQFPDDLDQFNVVIASDVLYERANPALVAAAFARTLKPGGIGILTDPHRRHASQFPEECGRHGLRIFRKQSVSVTANGKPQIVELYELALARTAS